MTGTGSQSLSSKGIHNDGGLTAGPWPKDHVLVDHDHEPVAGPDLESVWDRQACSRILLAELAELLPERTGSDLLAIVVLPVHRLRLAQLHAGGGDADQHSISELCPQVGVHLIVEAGIAAFVGSRQGPNCTTISRGEDALAIQMISSPDL